MPQRVLFKRLQFAYGSAATIIGVLILLAQIVIQTALYQEVQTRQLASTMSLQELHSQHLLRNALMSFNTGNKTINPLNINPAQQIAGDLIFLEATNKHLLDNSQTPISIVQPISKIQRDFAITDQASHQLLVDIKNHNKVDQLKQVTQIFIHEQAYLSGVYTVFVSLSQQADNSVSQIQILELALCIVALATITFEAFCVVIPAFNDYQQALRQIEQLEAEKRQAIQQQGGNKTS